MEGIHGVDVSWLHRSQREHNYRLGAGPGLTLNGDLPIEQNAPQKLYEVPSQDNANAIPKPTSSNPKQTRRPHSTRHTSADKPPIPAQPLSLAQKAPASSPLPSPSAGRRSSWISGITSKFSSSPPPPYQQPSNDASSQNSRLPQDGSGSEWQPRRTSLSNGVTPPPDGTTPYIPATPKNGQPSFLQSALRRFSSSSGTFSGVGKFLGNGGLCERRVMNVDVNRERCRVQGLDQAKLRRVAFCVDVEIAAPPKYEEDGEGSRCKRKGKDKNRVSKATGEADASQPPVNIDEEEQTPVTPIANEEQAGATNGSPEATKEERQAKLDKKKEKKKKSEDERKERKAKKLKLAEASQGTLSEHTRNHDGSSPDPSSRAHDQPTTDPLRIYRRCCQLRETNPLKIVTDQLSAATCTDEDFHGMVTCLNLSDTRLELSDAVTLADWLAVVAVKKLMLGNCGLGDEGVRVILGGLLAAKSPRANIPKRSTRTVQLSAPDKPNANERTHGVVEKLCLKNNPNIGRDGWRHISLFIYMSRSIKAIDLSMIPFPKSSSTSDTSEAASKSGTGKDAPKAMSNILANAISGRLGGSRLEELIISECGLSTEDVTNILDAVSISCLKRLGLANNQLSPEAIERVAELIRKGHCEGLDIGGNDLRDHVLTIAKALDSANPLYALCVADCNLVPSSLSQLLPALVSLPNFRFIDLSHNRSLFSTQPNALGLLRKYIPRFPTLKRLHLEDVALSSEHAIALAEILPESPSLAHLSILENPQISALASTNDGANQEEACALYASLMTAVRVSDTLICIDVDVPSPDSSEVVKALAKQVVAYCLRNMERGPVAEYAAAAAAITEPHGGEKELVVPEVLWHIVGHGEGDGSQGNEPGRDDDYVIGGTGVVKALGVCLGNTSYDSRRASGESHVAGGEATTPKAFKAGVLGRGKAKEMSKNLLGSARKIRATIQPALSREANTGDDMSYRRLLFLDQTLQRMIQRFEDEFPECRLAPAPAFANDPAHLSPSNPENPTMTPQPDSSTTAPDASDALSHASDDSDPDPTASAPYTLGRSSRHPSDVSLASRLLANEEGQMHRFGQQVRRDILRPQSLDHAHGTTGLEPEPAHLQILRRRLEDLGGMEIKERVMRDGPEAVLGEIGANAEELQRLALGEEEEPESLSAITQAREMVRGTTAGAGLDGLQGADIQEGPG